MANPFGHIELNTQDVGKAKNFYKSLFKWEFQDMQGAGGIDYTLIQTGTPPGGGLMKHPMPGVPSFWLVYVNVDNLAASTAKVKSLGGVVHKDITEVPGYGHFSIVADPTGAVFALWEPKKA